MPIDLRTAAAAATAVALVVLPGAAVLEVIGARLRDRMAQVGMAVGLGCALAPLTWLWLDTVHVPVNRMVLVALASLAAVAIALSSAARRRRGGDTPDTPDAPDERAAAAAHPGDPLAAATVAVLAAAAIAARWWSARDLDLPRWGDSVHHTIIVDLMTRAASLPADWRPYAELGSFSYHFGFHSLAAGIAQVSGLAPHEAVILAGQMLMVAGIASAYALGATLSGRPWVGVGAALAAAGLSTMPAYYLNWGRYTQLAGQVILPAAAAALVLAARGWPAQAVAREGGLATGWPARPVNRDRGLAGLASHLRNPWLIAAVLLVAGLALTHYIVVLFLVLFVAAWLVVGDFSPGLALARPRRRHAAVTATIAAVGGALVALPWVPHFLSGPIGGYAYSLSTARPQDPAVFGVNPAREVWLQADALIGWPLLVAFALGALVTIRRRDRAGWVSLLWVLALVLATHPALLGLPVSGVLKNFTVAIGLYIAAGPAVGVLSGAAAYASKTATALAVGAVALGGAWSSREVLVPETRLVGDSDLRALAWVRDQTPADATFLVSAFPAFGQTAVAGDDAGWWLPYVTGRASTLPPITYVLETPFEGDYPERVNQIVRLWHEDLDSVATLRALDAAGVTHAFVGEVARANDQAGRGQGLSAKLAASRYWELVHADGESQVWARTTSARGGETQMEGAP